MDVPGDESVHHHYIVWEPAKPSCGSDSYGRTMASMVHPEADWNDLTVEIEDAAEGWFGSEISIANWARNIGGLISMRLPDTVNSFLTPRVG